MRRLRLFSEKLGELFGHRAAELLGVDDGDGAPIIPRHVMADADRDQLDRRARFDFENDLPQMAFEIIAGIDGKRRVVDRRAVTIVDAEELGGAMTEKLAELFSETSRPAPPKTAGPRVLART